MAAPADLQTIVQGLMPALDASLDPTCVIDPDCRVVFMSQSMRTLLGVRPRDLAQKNLVFCDLIKLTACKDGCKIAQVIKTGEPFRLDETPASRGDTKLRVGIKVGALKTEGETAAAGAVICLRDTTAEILLQAKYHKSLQIIEEKDLTILDLEEKVQALQRSLRNAAGTRIRS